MLIQSYKPHYLAWEQGALCTFITQKGTSKLIMQQTNDATLSCIFLPCFAKIRICIIFFTSKKRSWNVSSNHLFMQCNQAQNLTQLSRAWFPALWFSPLRVFTVCLPVITTTISCSEFYYRKRFPVCFFKLERDFILKLSWMENFHESDDKTICKLLLLAFSPS